MDRRKVELERFEETLEAIRREFPALDVHVERDHPHVHALADIPAQPGLDFEVNINLQNRDELHLCVCHFWMEWFPCGDQGVFDRFVDAVLGVLSGRFRIVEFFVLGRVVKSQLQEPDAQGSWTRVATSFNSGILIPWKRAQRVVQNRMRG